MRICREGESGLWASLIRGGFYRPPQPPLPVVCVPAPEAMVDLLIICSPPDRFCGRECQRKDWKTHKISCPHLAYGRLIRTLTRLFGKPLCPHPPPPTTPHLPSLVTGWVSLIPTPCFSDDGSV